MGDTKRLISNSTIVFAGTIISSFFAYLFNMLMGRMLGPIQYGELTVILSLIMIIGVIGGAVLTVSMRYSGELYNKNQIKALQKLFAFFTKYLFFLSIGLFIISAIFAAPVAHFLLIENSLPVIIAFITVFFSLLIMINKGFLQGIQSFKSVSAVNVVEMFCRLAFGLLLVYLGFELNGAVSAIVLAAAIAYLISFLPLKKILKQKAKQINFKFNKREIISYSWPTLVTSILLALAMNFDIIAVKHYFDPETAGVYAAISTVAKIILYITMPISSVMFPMISEKTVKGDKHYKIFFMALLLTALATLVILAIYIIAPGKVISILYGADYLSLYQFLPEAGLFVLFYALSYLVINYYLVIKDFVFLYFFSAILLTQTIVVIFWHPSLTSVIRLMIVANCFLFIILVGYYLVTKRQQIKNYLSSDN